MFDVLVPISIGELIDKITILEIKKSEIKDEIKLKNVVNELDHLEKIVKSKNLKDITKLKDELFSINKKLWEIEDRIRELEKQSNFGTEFIDLARSVYLTNDKRFLVKKMINKVTESTLVEEKSYDNL